MESGISIKMLHKNVFPLLPKLLLFIEKKILVLYSPTTERYTEIVTQKKTERKKKCLKSRLKLESFFYPGRTFATSFFLQTTEI